jgi:hypothetical protein
MATVMTRRTKDPLPDSRGWVPRRPSQYGVDTFAPDDIQQNQHRAGWPLCAPLQLRDVANCQVQISGEHGLTHVRLFPQGADLLAGDGIGLRRLLCRP